MITFDISPVAKPRQTRSDKWKQRPCVMKYRAFADELRLQANAKGYVLGDTLTVKFFIPMPSSWSGSKKSKMQNTPHKQRPDIDNLLKSFMDALAKEDSHVYNVTAYKQWAYNGRIYVAES